MTDPTCRTCYADSLTESERDRFYSESITMPVFYCPEHEEKQREMLRRTMLSNLRVIHGSVTGRMRRNDPPLQFPRFRS